MLLSAQMWHSLLLDELGFSAEKMADTVEGFLKDE